MKLLTTKSLPIVCCGLLALALSGCNIVYKLPTRQGNVIEQEKLDQIEPGMTRSQVRFLLGTPLAASPFTETRWDYLGFYRDPRGGSAQRLVSMYFDGDTLVRAEGIQPADAKSATVATPENVRSDTGDLEAEPPEDDAPDAPEEVISPLPDNRRL